MMRILSEKKESLILVDLTRLERFGLIDVMLTEPMTESEARAHRVKMDEFGGGKILVFNHRELIPCATIRVNPLNHP